MGAKDDTIMVKNKNNNNNNNSRSNEVDNDKDVCSTKFYGSQADGQSAINYSYTDLPLKLLGYDIYYFFRFSWAIPYVILPAGPPYLSGDMDELSPTPQNIFCVLVHVVLIVLQLAFILLLLPIMILLPVWSAALAIAAFMVVNTLICKLLNGSDEVFMSNPEYAPKLEKHAHEQWIFVNGVAVGQHWLQKNLDRLALTFKRPILGIHNKTDGIIFDIVECLVQRTFGYATKDVRLCYAAVKEKLYDPQFSKVVMVLHSQGGIEGGMVLDWLLQEVPQDLLVKLEVYTFGNAANHFNNPHRHTNSQKRAESAGTAAAETAIEPAASTAEAITAAAPVTAPKSTELVRKQSKNKKNSRRVAPSPSPPPPPAKTETESAVRQMERETSAVRPSAVSDRVIGHVEHYAHTTDFVALWGVLHFSTSKPATLVIPRFVGRLFARTSPRGGHQFNMHYLDGMFPLRRDPAAPGGFSGCLEAGPADQGLNEFMDSTVIISDRPHVEDGFRSSYAGALADEMEGLPTAAAADTVKVSSLASSAANGNSIRALKVEQLSRLWQYRDGRSPEDSPGVTAK